MLQSKSYTIIKMVEKRAKFKMAAILTMLILGTRTGCALAVNSGGCNNKDKKKIVSNQENSRASLL
jgi:hypothetical protein